MQTNNTFLFRSAAMILASASVVAATGCNGGFDQAASQPMAVQGAAFQGKVFGGQQPIGGSAIHLYAASTAGYAAATTDLLTTPVQSDANGNYSITNDYSCTPGQQLYIVAMGGNPGLSGNATNGQAGIMAALGDCSNLHSSTFILMNEVTTVAAAYALAPFMVDSTHVGTSSTNVTGLARAFNNAAKLANTATGTAGGPSLAAGATLPAAEIYTLANVLAACVNSPGGTAGDGSACGTLFQKSVPNGSPTPIDTIGLALALAKNPTTNVGATYAYANAQSPFAPGLGAQPADWTVSVSYPSAAASAPSTTTVDASGNIWVANAGNNTMTVLAQSGTAVSGSPFGGNGLSGPAAVAIDAQGNAWVANKSGATLSVFSAAGGAVSGSPFSGSGAISMPASVAMDAQGNVWVANAGSKTVTELNSAGGFVYQSGVQATAPASVAINPR